MGENNLCPEAAITTVLQVQGQIVDRSDFRRDGKTQARTWLAMIEAHTPTRQLR